MRKILIVAFLLGSTAVASAHVVHHHRHGCGDCAPMTEYRGYYGYSSPDGYRVWEGDVDPSYGAERYGENGGTVHYGH